MHGLAFYQQSQRLAAYVLLPGIVPRIKENFSSPFATLASLIVDLFVMAALLPSHHPYNQPHQFGQFGLLDVLRAGSVNLRFRWRSADQILVYLAVVAALVCFGAFILSALLWLATTPSYASGIPTILPTTSGLMANIYQYLNTLNPDRDIALMLLDRTLGVTGNTRSGTFFGSAVPTLCPGGDLAASAGATCRNQFPSAFNIAALRLLQFYSTAIFAFALLFLLYLVMTLVMEVAFKGKPFGERINPFWGPLRLVAAIGLLVPIAPHGLNSAQYIVLYTAKISSAFATNAWYYYHQGIERAIGASTGPTQRNTIGHVSYNITNSSGMTTVASPLAGRLRAPDTGDLVRFLHLVATCEFFYEQTNPGWNVQGYFVAKGKPVVKAYEEPSVGARGTYVPYSTSTTSRPVGAQQTQINQLPGAASNLNALDYFNYGNIRIVFGVFDPLKYPETNGLKSLCGELQIPVSSIRKPTTGSNPIINNPGAALAHELYYNRLMALWSKGSYTRLMMDGFGAQMFAQHWKTGPKGACAYDTDGNKITNDPATGIDLTNLGKCNETISNKYFADQTETFQGVFQDVVNQANDELANPANFRIDNRVLNRGWAGAGVWFQNIAIMNGGLVSAVQQLPYGKEMPVQMENLRQQILQIVPNMVNPEQFCKIPPEAGKTTAAPDANPGQFFCKVHTYLRDDSRKLCFVPNENGPMGISGVRGYVQEGCARTIDNIVIRAINAVLGTGFIFNFSDNMETHPLAQLVTFGRSLLEASANNLLQGSAMAASGGLISVGNEDVASALKKTSSFFITVASLLFSAGFMLYYVLPMLPFVYFFFAMLSWVKAVFEALIGAPLWAASHLSLKGQGFGSPKSRGGYLLLFEILMRPIITVFALIASLAIFSAFIMMLQDLLAPIYSNMGRADIAEIIAGTAKTENLRGIIEVFFFKIFYILLIYMIAMSSFKLIDTIPNGFMRWFGGGAKSFAADAYRRDTPSNTFTSNTYVAIANPLQGILDKADEAAYEGTQAAAMITNEGTKSKPDDAGAITSMVQSIFGQDRKTKIAEEVKGAIQGMTQNHAEFGVRQMKLARDALKDAQDSGVKEEIDRAKKVVKQLEEAAMVHDPELLIKEVMSPGSTKLSSYRGDFSDQLHENMKAMKSLVERTHGTAWEMMQTQTENQGGVYAGRAQVNAALQNTVKQSKAGIIATWKKQNKIKDE